MMAVAYLFFMAVNLAEFLFSDYGENNVPLIQTITLAIAVSQALLFTMALLALLEVRFPGWRYIFRQLIPATMLIIVIFVVYTFCSDAFFEIAFYGFSGLYALLLAYYTRLFMVKYSHFRLRMDNYFSDNEAGRIKWIAFSFFAALMIGIMALLTTVFMSIFVAMIFTVVFDIFYIWFALRFINFTHRFHIIEKALDNDPEDEIATVTCDLPTTQSTVFFILEKKIEQWVADKQFIEKGITVSILSDKLQTNRHYLSSYINTSKGKTFREWINQLRIEEAKNLMHQHPDMTVNEIALQVGFTDKSHFIRQFTNLSGVSPKVWKKS